MSKPADIRYEDRKELPAQQVLALYQDLHWSSAEKPDLLLKALAGSHTVVTAWDGDRLVGLGNAISDGYLVVYYPHLCVHPDYQGKGIGCEIVQRLCNSVIRGFISIRSWPMVTPWASMRKWGSSNRPSASRCGFMTDRIMIEKEYKEVMKTFHNKTWNLDDPTLVSAVDEVPLWSAPFGQALLDTVLLRPGLQVLDIGSGLGFPALELAQRLGSSSQVYALEPWQAALERMEFKLAQTGIANVTIVEAPAEEMPLDNEAFDLITSNNGMNNVADLEQAWRECYRVAKPGAQLVFTENLPETMLEFYQAFETTLVELDLGEVVADLKQHIQAKRKPLPKTMSLIDRVGFAIQDIQHHRFTMRFLDGTTMFNHFLIQIAFLESWKAIVPEVRRERVFARLEARLNEIARQEGDLTLTVPFVCVDCCKGVAIRDSGS